MIPQYNIIFYNINIYPKQKRLLLIKTNLTKSSYNINIYPKQKRLLLIKTNLTKSSYNTGKKGVITLLRRGADFRFNKKWLIPILLLMPAITGGALLVSKLLGDTLPDLSVLHNPLLIIYWFFYMLLLGGPLQEEFGWRGYALDRLQSRYTALTSSVILGFIWAIWHLPLNFASDVGPQYSVIMSMFIGSIITITLISILFTWIYNNTNRSILAVLLFHASLNLSTFKLFPVFELESAVPYYSLFIIISVVIVLAIWGKKRLVKKSNPS